MNKRILFYVPYLKREHGGVYQYAVALLKILTQDTTNQYYILNIDRNEDLGQIIAGKPNFAFVDQRDYLSLTDSDYLKRLRLSLTFRNKRKRHFIAKEDNFFAMLHRYQIDIIHSPSQTLPQSMIPKISTMHDVQELHYPEFFTSAERARRAVVYKRIIDESEEVVVSYEHIRKDIARYFDKPLANIHTILLDMNNLWIDRFIGHASNFDAGYLPHKFLLYPAATWEHKNHIGLVRAVAFLKRKGVHVNVVCTGHKTNHFAAIEKLMAELNVTGNFMFLGIVDDQTLFGLYQRCHGVVVPTLYEAGSFPLMESILLGKAVISSNVTSLPETIGDDRFTFDPQDAEDTARKILSLWEDETFYQANLQRLPLQANRLRSNGSLQKFLSLYESMGKHRQH